MKNLAAFKQPNMAAFANAPRQTEIMGQPHYLSYINKEEAQLLKDLGGAGISGPEGIPAYPPSRQSGAGANVAPSTSGGSSASKRRKKKRRAAAAAAAKAAEAAKALADQQKKDDEDDDSGFSITGAFSAIGTGITDTIKEIASLGAAETQTYNNTGALTNITSTSTADAGKQYADSMRGSGVLDLSGKQIPDEPVNQGNTPILQYTGTGDDGQRSYEIVGGLDPNKEASMSTNDDGTLFVPYDGLDPRSIDANTNFPGSTDPNSPDYNMSKDLAENGSYVNLQGERVEGEPFTTDFPINQAAIENEIGKQHLLKTGDDSLMIVKNLDTGGYMYMDGTDTGIPPYDATGGDNPVVVDPPIVDPPIVDPPIVDPPEDRYQTTQNFAVEDIVDDFNRRRKSGMGFGLPEYMRRFMSGQVIDELVRRVELDDGSVFFVTPDGRYLDPEQFTGTTVVGDPTEVKVGEQQIQTGYTTTNLNTGETIEYDAVGNPLTT